MRWILAASFGCGAIMAAITQITEDQTGDGPSAFFSRRECSIVRPSRSTCQMCCLWVLAGQNYSVGIVLPNTTPRRFMRMVTSEIGAQLLMIQEHLSFRI